MECKNKDVMPGKNKFKVEKKDMDFSPYDEDFITLVRNTTHLRDRKRIGLDTVSLFEIRSTMVGCDDGLIFHQFFIKPLGLHML